MSPGVLCLLVLVGLGVGSVQAHPGCAPMSDVGLVVLAQPGIVLTGRNQADFEFGKINSLDNPQVEQRFTLRNEAEEPLVITGFETTCHCTTTMVETITGQPVESDAFVHYLSPGQEMVVKLTANLVRQPFGPMSHGAAIRVSGHDSPVARIAVAGQMEVPLRVSSSEMDFDPMKRGETQSRPLTITLDRRCLSGDVFPELVLQFSTESEAKIGDFIKIVPQTQSSSQWEKTFEIVVRPKQVGAFSARLVFAPIARADYKGTIPYDRAMEVLGGLIVDVRGEVTAK